MTSELSNHETIELGVVVERRKIDNPWQDYSWLPVAVMPGAEPIEKWRELSSSDDVTQYHAATLTLELFRSDTEAYVENLQSEIPAIFVVLSEDDDSGSDFPYFVEMITASPYEAQDLLDSGEAIIERVIVPDAVLAWIVDFVDQHHQDKPFKKRKRVKMDIEEQKFGKEPIFTAPKKPDPDTAEN